MPGSLQRAARLIASPAAEWRAIAAEPPAPGPALRFALSLSVVPSAAWAVKLMLFGGPPGPDREGVALDALQVAQGGLSVYACSLLSIAVMAAAIHALAPMFVASRTWPRAVQVAAYSAAPALLGGVLLAVPDFAFALLLAAGHAFFLMYGGLQAVLGVREDRAAEYVALGCVALIVASTILGAAGSALGLL